VLEGVACHARWLHEAVERFAKRRLEPIRIVGGGAQSELWCQIHADVLGRTVERVADPASAVLRGAALLAGVETRAVDQSRLRELVAADRVFEPDAANGSVYDRLFAEMPRLHKAQRGMSSRLRHAD
jgi:xylulokinase